MSNPIFRLIEMCDNALRDNNEVDAKELIDIILGKYGDKINNLDNGLDFKSTDRFFVTRPFNYLADLEKLKGRLERHNIIDKSIFIENISEMKEKVKSDIVINAINTNTNTNTNNNTNNIEMSVLFQEARQKIESNGSLSEEEIQEVLDKIDEIEQISKTEEPNNKKWFKLRPTMQWLGTKGILVAAPILNLINAILAAQ